MKSRIISLILGTIFFVLSASYAFAADKIQLIRNATLRIDYAGKIILVDPMLSPKGAFESFAGIEKNPTVELPMPVERVISDIDFVLLTHNHPDHWDKTAVEYIPKDIPVFVQTPDKEAVGKAGFRSVIPVATSLLWEGIDIQRTGGKHGSDAMLKAVPLLGTVSGYILRSDGHPTVYIIGDTLLNEEVKSSIVGNDADVIVVNSGGAKLPVPGFENEMILMGINETIEVTKLAPKARIIAVHMEALDHLTVKRNDLRKTSDKKGISRSRLIIPADGEIINLN